MLTFRIGNGRTRESIDLTASWRRLTRQVLNVWYVLNLNNVPVEIVNVRKAKVRALR